MKYSDYKFCVNEKVRYNNILADIFSDRSRVGRVNKVLPGDRFEVEFSDGTVMVLPADELQQVEQTGWTTKEQCVCSNWDLLHKGCRCGHFALKSNQDTAEVVKEEDKQYEKQVEDRNSASKKSVSASSDLSGAGTSVGLSTEDDQTDDDEYPPPYFF